MHEVVQLLLARMKSHPEEFAMVPSRWDWMLSGAMDHGSDEERAALKKGLRPIRLQAVHELMLDELCNGEERRRKQQEEDEYERGLLNKANNNMGKALRAAIAPALQRIDEQTLSVGTVSPSTKLHVSTIKKALGI